MVDVPEILAALAQKIATIDGVAACYYPKPAKLTIWPSVVLLWGGSNAGPTEVTSTVGFKTWTAPVTARVMVSTQWQPTREQKRIDDLITPLADLVEAHGGGVSRILPNLSGHVNSLEFVRVTNELITDFGGVEHYVADVVFVIRFKRRTPS